MMVDGQVMQHERAQHLSTDLASLPEHARDVDARIKRELDERGPAGIKDVQHGRLRILTEQSPSQGGELISRAANLEEQLAHKLQTFDGPWLGSLTARSLADVERLLIRHVKVGLQRLGAAR